LRAFKLFALFGGFFYNVLIMHYNKNLQKVQKV